MKKTKIKIITASAIVALLLCILAALTGCSDAKITDISVSESDPPRVEYVEGQPLDLTKGSITVKEKGKEKNVALSDTGISVSGYDAGQLGKQTLTVEYKKKSTSYEITVIARIVPDEFKDVYFVGEELDLSVGTVEIANDDASTFSVNFNDPRLSFEGFSTSEIGPKTVIVKYSDSGKSYRTSFTVNVYSNDAQDFLSDINGLLSDIPSNWTPASLANYKNKIEESVNLIFVLSENKSYGNLRDELKLLDSYRAEKDYFEIIYSYYCYTASDGHSLIANSLWQTIPLPDALEEWYSTIYAAASQVLLMEKNESNTAYLLDTTDFMLSYFEALKIGEDIKTGSDTLSKDIYKIINGDLVFENSLRRAHCGYITLSGELLGNKSYDELWQEYLALARLMENDELKFDTHGSQIEKIFELFYTLSPAELRGFLSSLNFLYDSSDENILLTDYTDRHNNRFFEIISSYYEAKLPEAAKPLFKQMIMAMENYSIACMSADNTSAAERFKNQTENVKLGYSQLTDGDKEIFLSLLDKPYEKLILAHSAFTSADSFDYGELQDEISLLESTLKNYFDVLSVITDSSVSQEQKAPLFLLLFSLYERANDTYGTIISSADSEIIAALSTERYSIYGTSLTLDAAFYISRDVFVSYQTSTLIESEELVLKQLLWDDYSATNLNAFLKDASYILEYKHFGAQLDKAIVDSVTAAFRALPSFEQKIFYMIGCSLYYDALEAYYHEVFVDDESAKEFATSVFEAEYAYVNYVQNTSNIEALDNFKSKIKTAISSYLAITNRSMRNSYFSAIYEYYKEIYNNF